VCLSSPTAVNRRVPQVWAGGPGLDFQNWETSEAGVEENKNPLVKVHRLPGPQMRGTGATLILVGIEP